MAKHETFILTSLTLIGIGVFLLIVFIFSGGFISSKSEHDIEPVWLPRTIDEIYNTFDNLDTDMHNYIWPTDITTIMTSAFGEFRSTHFHIGIDISTLGRVGAPVFASRDGYIEQVGVSPFGYGKYIVMRHEDGFSTLYAHLDSFSDPVDAKVYEQQKKNGRYSLTVNFEPDEFWYDRGEIIARSGSTGSGPPHIHFEIRDRNNNPVNPKFSSNISINDNVAPTFNRLAAIPADTRAFINGRITPVTIPAVAIRTGEFIIHNPIRIAGKIGLAVDVDDRNSDTWYRHGIYAMEFFIEDSLVYSLQYNRLPIDYRHQIRLHYDHHLLRTGRGRYRKLFIEDGNMLPLYSRNQHGSGFIDAKNLEPGQYRFRISASDFSGNTSSLSGTLMVEKQSPSTAVSPPPEIKNLPHRSFSGSALQIHSEINRDMLIASITHPEFIETPIPLIVRSGEKSEIVPFIHSRDFTHQSRIHLDASSSRLQFLYVYNDTVYTHTENIYSICPDRKGEISIDNGNLILSFDQGAVYYPVFFTVSRIETEDDYYYAFNSTSSVLDKGIHFSIRVPDAIEPFNRTIVYTRSGSRWSTHGSNREPENRQLTGMSRQMFNDIKVGADTTAPVISDVVVSGNRNLRLRFKPSDDESGIDHASLHIKLDDEILIGRYDPDLSLVIYNTREPFEPGTYALSITIQDRAGNRTDYNRTVIIQ
jgi:hypothetical protein